MNARYTQLADGREFRRRTFLEFASRYRHCVVGALEVLREIELEFPELNRAHRDQLRPDLMFRHSLPFCITEETFFDLREDSSTILAALLAGHTLALTHLDYHLDGSDPDPAAAATASKLDPAMAVTYSIRMVYAAGRILDASGLAVRQFGQVFDPVSGFVLARMHQDCRERYSTGLLRQSGSVLAEYLDAASGRAEASGYWEVMVRGSFVGHGSLPPAALTGVVKNLRRLRQVVDQIGDFSEDILAGLVTLPLLFAIEDSGQPSNIINAVEELWQHRSEPGGLAARQGLRRCRDLILAAGGFERSFALADSLWHDAASACSAELGAGSAGYLALLDLKRAKLTELRANGWQNVTTEDVFVTRATAGFQPSLEPGSFSRQVSDVGSRYPGSVGRARWGE